MVDDWVVQQWETGTLFGDGFQGGIWQSANDVVVGCCGTNPQQKGKLLSDLGADLRPSGLSHPARTRQVPRARWSQAAKDIAAGCAGFR